MSEKLKDTMALWESWCETPPDWTKEVKYGARKFTTACAQQQIKRGTLEWGPHGVTWGIRNSVYTPLRDAAGEIVSMLFEAELWFPGGAFDIASDMSFNKPKKDGSVGIFPGTTGEDWAKKLRTDARSKALSLLGMNSDIFEGKFDDNKYVAEMRAKHGGTPVVDPAPGSTSVPPMSPDDFLFGDAPPAAPVPKQDAPVTEAQLSAIRAYMAIGIFDADKQAKAFAKFGIQDPVGLTESQATKLLARCDTLAKKAQLEDDAKNGKPEGE